MLHIKKCFAIVCVLLIITVTLSGCSKNNNNKLSIFIDPTISTNDEEWSICDTMVYLENSNFIMELNAETTHFTVTNKKTNRKVSSIAEETNAITANYEQDKMLSELFITYYTEQSDAMYMSSTVDSVDNKQFTVMTNGDSIRVTYKFGAVDDVLPNLFDEKTFEEVLQKFENDAMRRRFSRYYDYFSSKDKSKEYEAMLKKYPVLSKKSLYVMTENLGDIEKGDIVEYMSLINFTSDDYKKMLDNLNVVEEDENINAGFVIPIEYSLNNNGISVKILSDLIKETTLDFKLQKIDVLPYFSSVSSANGEFFYPDGCGALMKFNNNHPAFSLSCYGEDYSVRTENVQYIGPNAALPVFGMDSFDGGYFAIVSKAEAVADINIAPKSNSSPLNHAYASFNMRRIDVTDYSAEMNIPIFNLFSKELIKVSPEINYFLLEKDSSNYENMAQLYREYLISNGQLKNVVYDKTPVYIDYLCMITEPATIMGVKYTKKIVLSTISEIIESVEKIIDANIGPCVVRLVGYSEEGYEHKTYNRFSIDNKVGTIEEVKELKKLVESSGGKLYFDADFQFAYKNGNGISLNETARYLNRLPVKKGQYNIVTKEYQTDLLEKFLISPIYYHDITNSMYESFNNIWKSDDMPGFSYGSSGLYLGGDYAKNYDIDRLEACAAVCDSISSISKKNINLMFDNGNAYILQYASDISNLPLYTSSLDSEANSVPFYQMVLHGYMNFAGSPINLSSNSTNNQLTSIAYGSAPYMAFITRSDELIANTNYKSIWYSLEDKTRIDDFIIILKNMSDVLDDVSSETLEEYEFYDNVSCSKYSNGYEIYVNFGEKDKNFNGITVPSKGYLISKQ